MKKLVLVLILTLLTLTGCSDNSDKENSKVINNVSLQEDKFVALEKKEDIQTNIEVVNPVPGQSFLDSMYANSDNKASDNESSVTTDTFKHDLSTIEEQAIKEIIISLYNDNQCTDLSILNYFFDTVEGQEVRYCVVKLDATVYVINYSNGKAYAIEDVYGIYEENIGLEQED